VIFAFNKRLHIIPQLVSVKFAYAATTNPRNKSFLSILTEVPAPNEAITIAILAEMLHIEPGV